jgi:outer membrane protein assembly factor BamB
VLTISILTAFFVLVGLSWMWFAAQRGLLLAPTPTATATPLAATRTPTPDVRATNVAGDMLTQVAFAATALARLTPQAAPVDAPISPLMVTPGQTQQVILPLVSMAGPQNPTPAQPASPLSPDTGLTATAVFIPDVNQAPSATPTATLPFAVPPPQPPVPPPLVTPNIAAPPTDTPTPFVAPPPLATPTPTILFVQVAELSALSRGANTTVYIGPSTFYTPTTDLLGATTSIRLRGRTQGGDWLLGCCLSNNQSFWVRTAHVTITGNPTPVGFPSGVDTTSLLWDANNPKWLPIYPLDPALTPRPQPTAIQPGDYPLARYDRANTGRVPALPRLPLQNGWGTSALASQPFRSPVAVMGANVLATSQDGQVYSTNRDNGTQRWRFNLGGSSELAPAVNDGLIYTPYNGNRIYVLQDNQIAANPVSDISLPANASTSPTFLNDVVFVGVGEGADARLMAMKRDNYADIRFFDDPQSRLLQPAIGQETIYVAGSQLWAVDVNFWRSIEIIWLSSDVLNVTAPPVYAYPGVIRTAELYVADASSNVYALDANTGARLWAHPFGSPVSMLAVNDANVFVAGGGLLRAVSRQTGQAVWTVQTGGALSGGPFVTNDRVLVVTQSGAVLLYDMATGSVLATATLPGAINAAPAISQDWLFAPSANVILGYRGAP